MAIEDLDQALEGEEVIQTNYSIARLRGALIDVLTPVLDDNQQVIGLVRVSYQKYGFIRAAFATSWIDHLGVGAGVGFGSLARFGVGAQPEPSNSTRHACHV